MVQYEGVHLRVTPQAIPQLRAAFEQALTKLSPAIADLGQNGWIGGAWMGDPKSAEVVALYNERVMRASDGPYSALLLYKAELTRIVGQLYVMEQEYRRTEQDTAGMFTGGVV